MYKKIKNQISFIAVYKIIIFLLNYMLVAYLIDYLGQENFGLYIALTSLFSWMFLFDLGIAKGMRNFVTLALAKQDIKGAKEYISTAYIAIFFLTIISFSIISSLLSFVDLQSFFSLQLDNSILQNIFFILLFGFFFKFYLSTVDQLNYAIHKSQNVILNGLLVVILNFIGILILLNFDYAIDIIYVIYIFSISIVLPYIYSTIHFFYKNSSLLPSLSFYSKDALKNILSKGSKILFIQIGFLLIIGIDRLILLKYGSPIEVSKYEIIYKVMSIIIFPVSIAMSPLWSAFTEAYSNNEIKWIKNIFKKFYFSMIFLFLIIIILSITFNSIILFWLNEFPYIEFILVFTMGILILEIIWSTFHTDFLLGIQQLSFIIVMLILGLILKFGYLYFYLNSQSNLNIFSIVLSSILAYSIYNISVPFYINKLLVKKG